MQADAGEAASGVRCSSRIKQNCRRVTNSLTLTYTTDKCATTTRNHHLHRGPEHRPGRFFDFYTFPLPYLPLKPDVHRK